MWITINKESKETYFHQIYMQIKILIQNGTLHANESMPSTRILAKELTISRNIILMVYDQLTAEGYLEHVPGSAPKVSQSVEEYRHFFVDSNSYHILHTEHAKSQISVIDFCSDIPDLSIFPRREWGHLYQNHLQEISSDFLSYQSPAGCHELRTAISSYLFRTRGLHCDESQIMIVSGSTQGLSLISQLLYTSNSTVLMENPTHPSLRKVIQRAGYSIIDVQADEHGLNPDFIVKNKSASFIYTTPSHQYPLGCALPLNRRIALLHYAIEHSCYVIENDCDNELRYEGQPLNTLYELCPQKVIYIGSFSKVFSPALRLGYMILPTVLISDYCALKQDIDVHTEALSQYVLADFINNGKFEHHIQKMKKHYEKKRKFLIKELHMFFGNTFEIKGDPAGLHLIVHFHNITFSDSLIETLLHAGVKLYPLHDFLSATTSAEISASYQNEVLLGYAHLTLEEITNGIHILHKVLLEL